MQTTEKQHLTKMDKIKFIFDTAIESGFDNEKLLGQRFDEALEKDEGVLDVIYHLAKKWKQ